MESAWLNPAGGLRYHTRALLGARLWAPFRGALGAWLSRFQPATSRAVLVGPSAAYCLPDRFLQRFSELTLLEPDPVAVWLLTRRLRRLGLATPRVQRADELIRPLLDGTAGLAERLAADREACVIFCNLLGQTRFLLQDQEFSRFKSAFRARLSPELERRPWLSFHDRFSSALSPSFEAPLLAPARLSDGEVLGQLYGHSAARGSAELLDHESEGFFPSAAPHAYFSWQIERARFHLIEGTSAQAGR